MTPTSRANLGRLSTSFRGITTAAWCRMRFAHLLKLIFHVSSFLVVSNPRNASDTADFLVNTLATFSLVIFATKTLRGNCSVEFRLNPTACLYSRDVMLAQVLAVGLCLCVCVSVCHTPVLYRNGFLIELVLGTEFLSTYLRFFNTSTGWISANVEPMEFDFEGP